MQIYIPTSPQIYPCECICTITGYACGIPAEYKLSGIPLCIEHSDVYSPGSKSQKERIIFPEYDKQNKPARWKNIFKSLIRFIMEIFKHHK